MATKADWHSEDIKAAVRKRGTTLSELATKAGLSESACRRALRYAWPTAEKVIADFLGLQPQAIWPSRYDVSGAPRRGLHSSTKSRADRRRRHRQK